MTNQHTILMHKIKRLLMKEKEAPIIVAEVMMHEAARVHAALLAALKNAPDDFSVETIDEVDRKLRAQYNEHLESFLKRFEEMSREKKK